VLFNNIPSAVLATGRNHVFGVTISVWVVALLAVVLLYILEHTPLGRQWYATGGSERVAFLAGIPTRRRKVAAFALAGLLVAIGAILELGSGAGANPNTGPDFLLPAYAAAFLGVTTYRLGRFNIVGSVVAILLLAVGFNGLSLLGVPFWAQPLFDGGVLLMAVLVAKAEARQVTVG
jgi:ribose transport system permease protein